jgi:hypothetical protein
MSVFHIQPHGRLQEWVADGNGYFKDEGLVYIFSSGFDMGRERRPKGAPEVTHGAFESYKQNDLRYIQVGDDIYHPGCWQG